MIVEDTGVGIPREKLKTVFEPLLQLDLSIKRKYGGVGLGLFIVKKIVEIHDGNIKVESFPNKGSKFIIHFPKAI